MTPSPDQLALLQAIIHSPDDDLPRLVYADWLEEHGHRVQARYIRGSIHFARMLPDDPERPKLLNWLETAVRVGSRPWAAQLGLARENPGQLFRRGLVHTLECMDLDDLLVFGLKWFDVAPIEGLQLHLQSFDHWWTEQVEKWEAVCKLQTLDRICELWLLGPVPDTGTLDMLLSPKAWRNLRYFETNGSFWGSEELSLISQYTHFSNLEEIHLGPVTEIERGLCRILDAEHLSRLKRIYFVTNEVLSESICNRLAKRCGSNWGAPSNRDTFIWV